MLINKNHMVNYILVFNFLSLIVTSSSLANGMMAANSRWFFLIIMLIYLIFSNQLFKFFDTKFLIMISIYVTWCFFTSLWSEVIILSFIKSILYGIIIITNVSIGTIWIKNHDVKDSFNYLILFTTFTLCSAIVGFFYQDSFFTIRQSLNLYQGLINGSNMFGVALAMAFPFLLWKSYLQFNNKNIFSIELFLLFTCILFLIFSLARSAYLFSLATFFCFICMLNYKKKIMILFFLLITILIIGFNHIIFNAIVHKYIYKESNQETYSLIHTREAIWDDTYHSALAAGWLGIGFGASIGFDNFDIKPTLSSVGYGREKGNSQLAILEETGIIGLILYLLVISIIAVKLIKLICISRDTNKILIGIITGTFIGILLQSIFEAWWTSPGSPESIYFWTLVGIIRGLEIKFNSKKIYYESYKIETHASNLLA